MAAYFVGKTGFEPATPWSQTRYSTGLNYFPKNRLLRPRNRKRLQRYCFFLNYAKKICIFEKKTVLLYQIFEEMMDYSQLIAQETQLPRAGVKATISLLDEKATIPFIARYRKEKTGSLDEVQIASIAELYRKYQEIADRKQTILATIEEQGKLTDELRRRIDECWDATALEDIYLPYKPHRKTRADVAREKGLQPLADLIRANSEGRKAKGEFDPRRYNEEQLQGARDILAEEVSQDERARNAIRRAFTYTATDMKGKKITAKINVELAREEGETPGTYRIYVSALNETNYVLNEEASTDGVLTITGNPAILGDVDGDGQVTIKDVSAIQLYIAEELSADDINLQAADIDGNGSVNISDATALQLFLAEYDVDYPIGQIIQ